MPFTRIGKTNMYKSPSGRKFTSKQVKLYYATDGFKKGLLAERKRKKKVSMSKESFVKEHKHLVKVLRSGSKFARSKEASDQARELSKMI